MAEASNDFIVEMLRRIQADVSDIKIEIREMKMRMSVVETQIAQLHVQYAEISHRIDRRDDLLDRVVRRLELADPAQ